LNSNICEKCAVIPESYITAHLSNYGVTLAKALFSLVAFLENKRDAPNSL
jgi:hypothetical protein